MMWKEYSKSYLKNNKASCISVMIAVMVSSLFLSFICTLFYNIWTDNIRRIISEEGDWQGKLIGELSEEELGAIKSHPKVSGVVVEEGKESRRELLIKMKNPRGIYEDLPEIAGQIGLNAGGRKAEIQYHSLLLTQYYIYSPEEKSDPPMLLSFYIGVMLLVCISLVLVIYHAFEMTGNERLHQLGILQSVGATPSQIRGALLWEAFRLSFLPVLLGTAVGIGLTYGFLQIANFINRMLGTDAATLDYHPLILPVTLCACFLTVWAAAGRAARRLSKINPLEAIRGGQEQPNKKVKRFRLSSALFGVEWELARKFLYVRRRAFRTSTLSLTISFLVLSIFLNFEALSALSTKYTYFERYKDTWDLMVTVKDKTDIDNSLLANIRKLPGVSDSTGYRKATGYTWLNGAALSEELQSIGGLEALEDTGIEKNGDSYLIEVSFVILDDQSYQAFRQDIKYEGSVDIGITVNRIWDNLHSHFRERTYLPYLKEESLALTVIPEKEETIPQDQIPKGSDTDQNTKQNIDQNTDQTMATISELNSGLNIELNAFTQEVPELREEYEDFSLVQIIPDHAYEKLEKTIAAGEAYYQIRAASENELAGIQEQINGLLDGKYEYELENRKEEEEQDIVVRQAYDFIMGCLCGLLAFIGIANVFANTLGGIYLRKREFARYLSVGFTPGGLVKILTIEGAIIGIRPILISLPFNVLFVAFALNASKLLYRDYITVMPVLPIAAFAVLILASVGLAYYIAGRRLFGTDIVESLKDDTMY